MKWVLLVVSVALSLASPPGGGGGGGWGAGGGPRGGGRERGKANVWTPVIFPGPVSRFLFETKK